MLSVLCSVTVYYAYIKLPYSLSDFHLIWYYLMGYHNTRAVCPRPCLFSLPGMALLEPVLHQRLSPMIGIEMNPQTYCPT